MSLEQFLEKSTYLSIIPEYGKELELNQKILGLESIDKLEIIQGKYFSLLMFNIKNSNNKFSDNLGDIVTSKDNAYAVTITAAKDLDATIRDVYKSKGLSSVFSIEAEDITNYLLLLRETKDMTPTQNKPISYFVLTKEGGNDGRSLYLIQNLKPNSVSSQHKHDLPMTRLTETYINLFGSPELNIKNKEIFLERGDPVVVLPGEAHQIRNKGKYTAQNLLVLNPLPEHGKKDKVITKHLNWKNGS